MKRYHQNISIDGKDMPAEYNNRKKSNFFNEGKWNNFILPLLPKDPKDRTFIEIGCNVGLYLRMATEYGFRNVVGIEADAKNCEMAEKYRDAHSMSYKILNRTIGEDFSFDELPVADVVLLSNMHYYIPMSKFLLFLDQLLYKTIECIVVSRQIRDKKHGYPLPDEASLRSMFRDWEMVRTIQTSSKMLGSDPHPRNVYSLLFRGRLRRHPIEEHTRMEHNYPKHQEWIDIIREKREVNLEDTLNWKFWAEHKKEHWDEAQIREHVQYRLDFVRDMIENGMKEPILARPDGIGIDGGNRAAVLRLLGYESIVVRVV